MAKKTEVSINKIKSKKDASKTSLLVTEAEFIRKYDEFGDAIFRHCFFRVKDREKAKDLTQETFLKAWEYIAKGERVENWKAFLYRVATNASIDEIRKWRDTQSLDQMQEDGFDIGEDTTESLMNQIDGAKALQKLAELPEMYQEVLFMRYSDDLSIGEIAELLDEKENAVSVRIHRGLKKLKELIDQ